MSWPLPSKLNEFYGNPDANNDGFPDARWEALNLIRINPPYPLFWSWSGEPVKTLRVHRKCGGSLLKILEEIENKFTAIDRHKYQLDQCGGVYNFRLMRGGNKLSTHSWGCAIDLAPEINALGVQYDPSKNMMPKEAVRIFTNEGWQWGGPWSRPDCMHFQATS